jgi:hypothetical protein
MLILTIFATTNSRHAEIDYLDHDEFQAGWNGLF